MKYLTCKEMAIKWNVSIRTVRNYCFNGKVIGASLDGKTWKIPEDCKKPIRSKRTSKKRKNLLSCLKEEKEAQIKGGIYHRLQVEMTYNSNHIEGSKLTLEQTRYIFETHSIGCEESTILIDDIIETSNHFRCIDLVIELANNKLSESFIKQLHFTLKAGTSDQNKSWFKVGDYKIVDNEVAMSETTPVKKVKEEMVKLLKDYNNKKAISIYDIIDFHYKFEKIHPFSDGNGRIGRLIMLKECLKHNITPILIKDDFKLLYYRGLKEYKEEKGFLIDTCLYGQDILKKYLDKFNITYKD